MSLAERHFTDALRRDLARHAPFRIPRVRGAVFAAVSIVVAPGEQGTRIVLIGRSRREGDRWSGDVAFPGGLASSEDDSGLVTARREAREEVGLVLGEPVGRLSDRLTLAPGRSVPMRIRPFVFVADDLRDLAPDPREVEAIYTPTFEEIDRAAPVAIERSFGLFRVRFEGRTIGAHHLWGLTAGLVRELRERLARGGEA